MKKSSNILRICALVIAPFLASVINEDFGGLVCIACIVIGIVWYSRKHKARKKSTSARKRSHAGTQQAARPVVNAEPQQTAASPLETQRQAFFYQQSTGKISYFYTDVGVYVPDLVALSSSPEAIQLQGVALFQDPNNVYDNKAVAVCQSCGPIAYLYRGKIQDMANDWLGSGRKVYGYISYIDTSRPDANKNGLKIDIYFY